MNAEVGWIRLISFDLWLFSEVLWALSGMWLEAAHYCLCWRRKMLETFPGALRASVYLRESVHFAGDVIQMSRDCLSSATDHRNRKGVDKWCTYCIGLFLTCRIDIL